MIAKRNIIAVIAVIIAILSIRLFFLQVLDESYKITAENNAFRYDVEYPARGIIYDRNGKTMVENNTTYDIMVTPRELKDVDTADLCRIFKLSTAEIKEIFRKLGKNKGYVAFTFLKQVSSETYAVFRERADRFPGFYSVARTMRVYPRMVGGNILGYIQEVDTSIIRKNPYYKSGDYIGKSGIEESYEEILRGKKGVSIYLRDARNKIVDSYEGGKFDSAAIPGKNIISSIDAELQEYVQEIMKNKAGSVVAIEPATGEILALVSSPTFDPAVLSGLNRQQNYSRLQNDPAKPLFNRAIMSTQPPGSTFKLVNGLIALQEEVITPNTSHSCGGSYPYGRGVGCHAHFSPVNFIQSIMVSCNAYYCYTFRAILDNRKYPAIDSALNVWRGKVRRFGFAQKLGVDLPSERSGIIASKNYYNRVYGEKRWNSLSVISLSIGQGEIGTTTLQLANMSAIIANKGHFYTPHIVKAVEDSGRVIPRHYEKRHSGISEEYFDYTIQGMSMAVNGTYGATAWRARIPDIEVCGKTGTSENPHGKSHSVFVCFAPRENPRIAVAVIVENAGSGGGFAAPLGSLAVEKYLKREILRPHIETPVRDADLISNNPLYEKTKDYKF
ncbi:MAG: penicillin-binding protein 2 [Prevotellaceae bacterium]|jgi:penicillin-binding protein 2|nr:penicillin-binding protein 2 [Prevotellaceae bacterium]